LINSNAYDLDNLWEDIWLLIGYLTLTFKSRSYCFFVTFLFNLCEYLGVIFSSLTYILLESSIMRFKITWSRTFYIDSSINGTDIGKSKVILIWGIFWLYYQLTLKLRNITHSCWQIYQIVHSFLLTFSTNLFIYLFIVHSFYYSSFLEEKVYKPLMSNKVLIHKKRHLKSHLVFKFKCHITYILFET